MDYIKNYDGTLYGSYRTKKFGDVWSTFNDFIADNQNNDVPMTIHTDIENNDAEKGTNYN